MAKLIGRPVELRPLPLSLNYPQADLRREVRQAGVGLVVCLLGVLFFQSFSAILLLLGVLAVLLAGHSFQLLQRINTQVEVTEMELKQTIWGRSRTLPWGQLKAFRLHFYANHRGANQGSFILSLKGDRGWFKMDSSISEFPTVLAQAAQAARKKDMFLHPTTMANMAALDL